jgi:uncharacterized protein YukE
MAAIVPHRNNSQTKGPATMIAYDPDFYAICRMHGVREPAYADVVEQWLSDMESLSEFLKRMKPEKPHWFSAAAADVGEIPAAVFDLTEQGKFARENGPAATAEMLSKHGLKLGQVKQASRDTAETIKGQNNPYSAEWRGTEVERQSRITSIIRSGGTKLAASLAKSAGKKIDGTALAR